MECQPTQWHLILASDWSRAMKIVMNIDDNIFRMPIYLQPDLWLVESNVDQYEYWCAEYFVLGQATPSDLNVVNPSALCPIDHACTIERFWVTTYTLTQSLGGACYFCCTQYKGYMTHEIWLCIARPNNSRVVCECLVTTCWSWISPSDLSYDKSLNVELPL